MSTGGSRTKIPKNITRRPTPVTTLRLVPQRKKNSRNNKNQQHTPVNEDPHSVCKLPTYQRDPNGENRFKYFFKKMEFCDQTTWWDVYDSVSLQRQNCWWTAGCLPAALRTTAPSREEDFEVPAAPPKAARAPTSAAGAGGAAAGGTGDPPVREAKALAIMAASIPAFWAVATAAAVPAAAVAAAAGAPLLAPCSADSAPPIECKRHVTTF